MAVAQQSEGLVASRVADVAYSWPVPIGTKVAWHEQMFVYQLSHMLQHYSAAPQEHGLLVGFRV